MAEKYYEDKWATIYCGHVLDILKSLPSESVQVVMGSPPYWGLRNYAGGEGIVWSGDPECQHQWSGQGLVSDVRYEENVAGKTRTTERYYGDDPTRRFDGQHQKYYQDNFCSLCGAWKGQLGLEPTWQLYVEHMVGISREIRRVLKKEGSYFLVLGDTYAGGSGHSMDGKWPALSKEQKPMDANRPSRQQRDGITRPKQKLLIPYRVAMALQEDGWTLRNDITWHKPNAMPSSVKDRLSTTTETIFHFVKARKYYYNLDAIRVPHASSSLKRFDYALRRGEDTLRGKAAQGIGAIQHREGMDGICAVPKGFNLRVRDVKRGKGGAYPSGRQLKASDEEVERYQYPEKHHGSPMNNEDSLHRDRLEMLEYDSKYKDAEYGQPLQGFVRSQSQAKERQQSRLDAERRFPSDPQRQQEYVNWVHDHQSHPKGKNPGDIVEATTVRHKAWMSTPGHPYTHKATGKPQNPSDYWDITTQPFPGAHFAVYPERLCEMPILACSRPGDVVLDPFAGSGTTGVVAKKLGRKAILVDCVEAYCAIAKGRLRQAKANELLERLSQMDLPLE